MSLFLVIYNAIRVYKSLQLTSSLTLLTLAGAHNAGEANAARTRIQKHGVRLHCDSDEWPSFIYLYYGIQKNGSGADEVITGHVIGAYGPYVTRIANRQ